MLRGGQSEWAYITKSLMLRAEDLSIDGISQNTSLVSSLSPLEPFYWFDTLIPEVFPSLLLMVHTSNFLWKQQQVPPSSPVHTHTHSHRLPGQLVANH